MQRVRTMREEVKSFRKAVESGDTKTAESQMSSLYKAIDKAAKGGVIKDNTASRKKSRLAKFLARAQS